MRTDGFIVQWLRQSMLLSVLLAGAAAAESVPAPHIDIQSNGNYVVSYQPCSQCSGHGVEEYSEQTASWTYVGSGDVSILNRAAGTYRYRVVYFLYLGRGGYQPAQGPDVTVIVDDSGRADLPTRASLPTQLAVDYAVSSGHIDGDGNRDLLIRRSSPAPDDQAGTISDVLLKQNSQGILEASLPDQWQLSVAANWSPANLEVQKRDVNIDGYVDLVLRGVDRADGFGQVENQILFAPGDSSSRLQPELRAVDSDLAQFSRDIDRHLIDPDYYRNNVPLKYSVIVYYSLNCGWIPYEAVYEGFDPWGCSFEPWYVYVVYRDLSIFDQDAMQIAQSDYAMIHGYESAPTAMERIENSIARVLGINIGGWDINELLGETDAVADDTDRRGMELFAVLAAISDAVAEEEADQAPDTDRVLVKGRRVLGQGPFHTALEYRGSTVSAYDSDARAFFDGDLVSQVNWPRDNPSLTMRMGFVDGPSAAWVYWSSLLLADSRYDDDLPYDLFPSLGQAGYNSNSFISGIVAATLGQPTIQLDTFVGGERPVPASEFY